LQNQLYLELPDGKLMQQIPRLQYVLGLLAATHGITRLVTTGEEGYDKHPDHIATYIAAVGAALEARLHGRELEVWGLNSRHCGELAIYGDRERKLGAIACHATQKAHPDLTFWGGTPLYTPLILGPETYDLSPGLTDTTHTRVAGLAAL
jgi:LmbE family N-acetylglucosaminyl deacetylase